MEDHDVVLNNYVPAVGCGMPWGMLDFCILLDVDAAAATTQQNDDETYS